VLLFGPVSTSAVRSNASPFPDALDDAAYRRELGLATSVEVGVRVTLEEFARLQKEGRPDARELG
jgi:hypothetical protein